MSDDNKLMIVDDLHLKHGHTFKLRTKVTSAVLVAAMTFALIPKFIGNDVVLAAGTKNDENTCLGTSKMASPATPTADSEWSGSKVYFGTYGDEPILFRVLAPSTLAYGGSTLFLDSDKTLFSTYFDNTSPYSNSWANSDIRVTLNGSFLNGFTDLEKEAIAMSSDNGGCSYAADSWQKYVYGSPVSVNDKVFLLDAAEITNEAYGYSSDPGFTLISGTWSDGDYSWHTVPNHIKGGSSDYWWLRSANSSFNYYAGTVFYIGSLSDNDVRGAKVGVAPALNINQSSIIFSSLISGSFKTVGAEYKLTIKDPDLDIAVPAGQQVDVSGTTVTVPYEIGGANAGTATRASILITDKEWDASGSTIKLYDALGTNTDTSGTFTLPSDLDLSGWGTDYHVYILAEDINDGHDGKDTDYASAPVELASPMYTIDVIVMTYDSDGVTLITDTPDIGGTASVDPTTAVTGTEVALSATPSTGYQFKEWVITSAAGGTIADPTSANTTYTIGSTDVTIQATFEPVPVTAYTVTVNSGSADVTGVAQGTTVTLTADAAPTGKEFDKWEIVSGTITLTDATSATTTFTMPAEDVEVTATYKDIPVTTYTVTFETNGGSAVTAQTVNDGAKAEKPADPTKEGFTFDGWYQDATCSVAYDYSTAITADITLYAKWTPVATTPTPTPSSGAILKTGEDTSMTFGLAILCFVLSGAVFCVVLFERKKRKRTH